MSKLPVAVVTGAAGFIGSHMVDCLVHRGFEVRAIDNLVGGRELNLAHHKSNKNVVADFRDILKIEATDSIYKDAQYIFHFAGIGDIVPSIDNPYQYMLNNVMGTVKVLEAARAVQVKKLVYAASSSCFGLAQEFPTPENAQMKPEYPYALSKYQGEQAVMHWGQVYSLPVNSIRMFNVYGPRSRTSGVYGAVFGVFLKQKLAAKPYTVVGDGKQTRDFVFVTDVARAFLKVAENAPKQEVYNLGAGKPQSVNRLVELLGGDKVYIPKRPGEPDCTWADISKIQKQVGWQPETSFENGVGEMLKNIDYWSEAPLWDVNSIEKATRGWFEAFNKKG